MPFVSISFLHEPPFRVFGSSRRSFLPELRVFSASFFTFIIFCPSFCLDRPFGFSIHQEAHFCLGRPFGFSTYHSVLFICLDKVFLDYIGIHRVRKFHTIHVCKNQSSAGEGLLDNIWSFVVWRPLAPWVGLLAYSSFQNKFTFLEFPRTDFLVKSSFHSCLIQPSTM